MTEGSLFLAHPQDAAHMNWVKGEGSLGNCKIRAGFERRGDSGVYGKRDAAGNLCV